MSKNMNMNTTTTTTHMNMNINAATETFFGLSTGTNPTDECKTHSGPIGGELIFDKFIHGSEEQRLFQMDSYDPTISSDVASTTELNASIVDNFFESPSTDNSPMFDLENQDVGVESWTSLFDNDIPVTMDDVSNCANDAALESEMAADEPKVSLSTVSETKQAFKQQSSNSFLPTPVLEDNLSLEKKQVKTSSGCVSKPSDKYDHLGVITYNRKQRSAPLTPVIPESDDPLALKRAKNTEAARRSRARKLQRMNQLEERVENLLKKNTELENEVARLRAMLGQ